MKFSKLEVKQLLAAWLGVSIAFGIALTKGKSQTELLFALVIAAVSVGLGFIVHELSHKFSAQRFGCMAEFRADYRWLVLGIIMSFTGFLFVAPGAVLIFGRPTRRQNGIISVSGPVSNLVVGAIFFALYLFSTGMLNTIAQYGFWINSFLALFNMLPFGPLDGRKVLAWNKPVFGAVMLGAVIMCVLSYSL